MPALGSVEWRRVPSSPMYPSPLELEQADAALLERLSTLKVHRAHGRPTLKKPVLIMVVLSAMERGVIRENKIRLCDLEATYRRALEAAAGKPVRNLTDPFVRLATAEFWTLQTPDHVARSSSKRFLYRDDVWASLDREVYNVLMTSSPRRRALLSAMIAKWIPPERREAVRNSLEMPLQSAGSST